MPPAVRPTSRAILLIVLAVLVLTVCASVYVFAAQRALLPRTQTISGTEEEARLALETRRGMVMLTVLLVSALLILLFVVGAYLVIRMGQLVSRPRVGGKPTEYVDAWRHYRLTDEQILAATDEDRPEDRPGKPPSGPEPPRES